MSPWLAVALAAATMPIVAWLAYPGVVILLAGRRRPPPPRGAPGEILVSVVIATRDPPSQVRERLTDILAGDWPAAALDLVVAVDGDPAAYDFAPVARGVRRLTVVGTGSPSGKAVALNAGVAVAEGDTLVFADTAQRFAPDAIPRLVAALHGGPFAAVSGALRIGNEADLGSPLARYWRLERRLRAAEAALHSSIGVTGAIYGMHRSRWSPLPAGLILDDLWIPMQLILAGHRVGFEPTAVAHDLRVTTPGQEYHRKVRTLTGNLQLLAWMPALLLPWRNPVWVQFTCHKLLRLATPFALATAMVSMVVVAFQISRWAGGLASAGGLLVMVLPWVVPGAMGRKAREVVSWAFTMQAALVAATWNGVRGRWGVWQR